MLDGFALVECSARRERRYIMDLRRWSIAWVDCLEERKNSDGTFAYTRRGLAATQWFGGNPVEIQHLCHSSAAPGIVKF